LTTFLDPFRLAFTEVSCWNTCSYFPGFLSSNSPAHSKAQINFLSTSYRFLRFLTGLLQGVPERFSMKITFLEEPPFIIGITGLPNYLPLWTIIYFPS
jgi:hypothetical protein